MVIVPVRRAPVFAATLNATAPLPDPVAPPVMVIHGALLVAVHVQPTPAVTFTVPVDAVSGTLCVVGAIEYVQATAACVMVNVWPAMVAVPVRCGPVFAATLYPTAPFPDPAAPDVIVIQGALLAAVHVQPAVVVTFTAPVDAVSGAFWAVGAIE